ncbi:hypothetical protein FSO04_30865 [Paraburkholderia madseniana]|uniref:Effector-associated domain-containing protein n=1 Tax=Paraburkholderia madseniana TaxID=2599607 RepID=A0A6N6W887_9BURK|nr:effector-associated domain EAD1-containing protein [Paraburkholderia madseniana]KAE8756108.1 hypothetical protein FSO04_30865 [Paraburkholderia madseniana]
MAYVKFTGPQLLELSTALKDAFDQAALSDLLTGMNRDFVDYAGYPPYKNQVRAIVTSAAQEYWLDKLIANALAERPEDVVLQRIESALNQVALPQDFDPFEMCCLSGEYVMVNRKHLRCALRGMSAPHGKRILIVRDKTPPTDGALVCTKTGKSLSVQFISALKQQLHGFELAWIDLRNFNDQLGSGVQIQPRDLGVKLVRLLGYDVSKVPPEPKDSQWSRWTIDFCDDFEAQTHGDGRSVWIVIDEFNKVGLPQATLDVVKQLAARVAVTLTQFRLILLGYRDTFVPAVLPHVEEETIDRALSERDVVDFFIRATQQRHLIIDDERIVEAASEALMGLDPGADAYLEEVGNRARVALARFSPEGG